MKRARAIDVPRAKQARMIHVLAFTTAKPGKRAELLAAFDEIAPLVRREPGCIAYEAATDVAAFGGFQAPLGDDTYVVVERWESAAALRDHAATPHLAAMRENTRAFVETSAVHVLEPQA